MTATATGAARPLPACRVPGKPWLRPGVFVETPGLGYSGIVYWVQRVYENRRGTPTVVMVAQPFPCGSRPKNSKTVAASWCVAAATTASRDERRKTRHQRGAQ